MRSCAIMVEKHNNIGRYGSARIVVAPNIMPRDVPMIVCNQPLVQKLYINAFERPDKVGVDAKATAQHAARRSASQIRMVAGVRAS